MSDWQAIAKARELHIPEDAIARIAPALDLLHAEFAPLAARLPYNVEPAIVVSESAVIAEPAGLSARIAGGATPEGFAE